MTAELWVGLVAVFVSGGAIGSAGTLLAQWLFRRIAGPPPVGHPLEAMEMEALRTDVVEIGRQLRNLDARLDFTEQLLDGALPLQPPPSRLDDTDPGAP